MALNVISNFAANVALRNLGFNSDAATRSVAKLSAGKRVVQASDDVAAHALGSRLRAQVAALNTVTLNANQGISLLQVADGALARIQDILTRQKALAVQAGSQNLSDRERDLLNLEYQQLIAEIERISRDTEFNGIKLVDRSSSDYIINRAGNATKGIVEKFDVYSGKNTPNNGVLNITARGFRNRSRINGGDGQMTVSMSVGAVGVEGTPGAPPTAKSTLEVRAIVKNEATGSMLFWATINPDLLVNNTQTASRTVLADLITGTTLILKRAHDPVSQQAKYSNGAAFGDYVASQWTEFTRENAEIVISLGEDFDVARYMRSDVGVVGGGGVAATHRVSGGAALAKSYKAASHHSGQFEIAVSDTGPTNGFTFKVGTGANPFEDAVGLDLQGATVENLALQGTNLRSLGNADSASEAVSQAIDFLVRVRSDVGATVNRMQYAIRNIATSRENTEAARSRFLDLNVSEEVTAFTNKQILVQVGISVLAQANQLPQNLLRLFQ